MAINTSHRRQRLRHATQHAHARLDALIEELGFFRSSERYALYLEATWNARRPTELALEASGVASLYAAWPRRSVFNALSLDMADLSARPLGDDPSWQAPHACLSPGQALGTLYVLEGSALGARLLIKRAEAIDMTSTFGARHMARQIGHPTAWTQFVDLLERADLDPSDDARCLTAAIETFGTFERAFRAAGETLGPHRLSAA